MLTELYDTWPKLPTSHVKFIESKLSEEVEARGEKSLRTAAGMRLAVRNLAKVFREETKEGKEFFDYVTPPNGRGSYEAIFYSRMCLLQTQGFWCEDSLDEEVKKWKKSFVHRTDLPKNHHQVLTVIFPREVPLNERDTYLAFRMLLRVEY